MAAYEIEVEDGASQLPDRVRRGIRESDPAEVRPRGWEALCLSVRDGRDTEAG
jgi:hypothetical protein